ncbi:MAG: hypothetical protein HYV01_00050 [Deltaproteobacteria bacterium]|nr:hypothetical protein [Deltaproteobacteria bacterium]
MPRVTTRDLSKAAIAGFHMLAKESRRVDASVLRESAAGLLENLNLFDGDRLKRAAGCCFIPTRSASSPSSKFCHRR